jgi:hypothetical protein
MDDLVKRLHDSQPLQANLVALAKQPKHTVKTFGAEWAGMCAASALDEIERLRKEVEALRVDAERWRLYCAWQNGEANPPVRWADYTFEERAYAVDDVVITAAMNGKWAA